MTRIYAILISILWITGCANNQITQIHASPKVISYHESDNSRFKNLYEGEKQYPVTCEEDCYPETKDVVCELRAENCQYQGIQHHPKLSTGFSIQWLGHASFKITHKDGTQLLLDPVSKQFDWPVNWAFRLTEGFNRKEPGWLSDESLKQTDAVLYSHIHYDHFSKSDIARMGNKPDYLVPLEFASRFTNDGYKITEMSWYGETPVNNLNIHFVPAHHFSSRIWVPYIYNDDDKTLWGGWVIEYKDSENQDKRIFYAGDTGYSKHFADIREKLGAMDVCLIPIASYYHPQHSKWYRYVHTTPEDAIVAAKELDCKVTIPWGYGNNSWKMGDHSSHSPLLRLLHMHKQMETDVQLYILNEGESVDL